MASAGSGGPAPVDLPFTQRLLRMEAAGVLEVWEQLCQWDPLLPPESRPPMGGEMIAAMTAALARPQPLGYGPDPEIERIAGPFAKLAGSIDVAVGQLVCLREALFRRIQGRLPEEEAGEALKRSTMLVDRAMALAAASVTQQLQQEVFLDPLTGLLNRRALERDGRREIGRAARYGRALTFVVADLAGLKSTNDNEGHAAGDEKLKAMAAALVGHLRVGDQAYRIGGDEFVVMLPEQTGATAEAVVKRVRASGAPEFSWGAASFPDDASEFGMLLDAADSQMLSKRKARMSR